MSGAPLSERPKPVRQAGLLILISLVLGFVRIGIDHERIFSHGILWFKLLVMGTSMGVLLFISYKWYMGKNWARITFTVLSGLGIIVSVVQFIQFPKLFERNLALNLISSVQSLLQLGVIMLIFTPLARPWFKKGK